MSILHNTWHRYLRFCKLSSAKAVKVPYVCDGPTSAVFLGLCEAAEFVTKRTKQKLSIK